MTEVQQMKLADIHPYERNPRRNDDSVDAVAKSIREFCDVIIKRREDFTGKKAEKVVA